MNYPPRLAHLATKAVLSAKLGPTYAEVHQVDDEEAHERLSTALTPALVEQLLGAVWAALKESGKKLDDAARVEKVAQALADRPLRPGRRAPQTPGWSAFLLVVDANAGTASDMAWKVLDSPEGRRKVESGMEEVGRFVAAELTRR